MLHIAKQPAELLAEEDIEIEIIDLRTIIPFDAQTCIDSVMRIRLVVLQEGQWSGGLGHTIQSRILESCFYALESAPCVIGALEDLCHFHHLWKTIQSPRLSMSPRF